MYMAAKNYANFIRIDDEGNEIIVKVIEKIEDEMPKKLTRKDYISSLEEAINHLSSLPDSARFASVNQYEMEAYLKLLLLIFQTVDLPPASSQTHE